MADLDATEQQVRRILSDWESHPAYGVGQLHDHSSCDGEGCDECETATPLFGSEAARGLLDIIDAQRQDECRRIAVLGQALTALRVLTEGMADDEYHARYAETVEAIEDELFDLRKLIASFREDPSPSVGDDASSAFLTPSVTATRYSISVIPSGVTSEAAYWDVTIEWRGDDRWAVLHFGNCLGRDGSWDYEPLPSERTDEWLEEHRYGLDEALDLASKVAPTVSINGKTPADIIAAHYALEGSGGAPGRREAETVPDGAR